ncbi:SRPBCC domain-containing protein [Chitinophaga pendula]|uniref:SRPBCC family protein n=1 Tax=Chitinophaga TaxID=79328 RepID=UPI000BAF1BBA|nr:MULTISPECIES: SRPBCC domain-containing protein [Chitinophaga]ASZ13642.1 ATPase [Chitinophaga sp. MD30]UCJ08733.1 SRPBCC domain-containing protein [Chitinophaga pendula]
MKRLSYNISINAPKERVWEVLWQDAYYRQWTAPFSDGSHAVSDWKKGSKVLFLDPKEQGMLSRIDDLIPNEYMSFRHLGEVKDGKEDFTSAFAQECANNEVYENYTLQSVDGKTNVRVDTDLPEEYVSMMDGLWPKALQQLKEIAERYE